MYNDYPYTDFHSLNLDYLLKKYREVDSKVAGLRLSANGETNKIELLDSDGNVMNSITVPFATNASHSTSANSASSASSAVNASKDVNNKNLTSYVADASYSENVLTLKDGENNNIRSFNINPPSSVTELINCYYNSGSDDLCDESYSLGHASTFITEFDEIEDLRNAFNQLKSGSLGSFVIYKDSNMDSIKQIAYPVFVTTQESLATPRLCFYVIYGETDVHHVYPINIKWRLFELTIFNSKIDGKAVFVALRYD